MPLTVDVALPLPLDSVFSYDVPDDLADGATHGMRAIVQFRRDRVTGVVVGVSGSSTQPIRPLKPVLDFPDPDPALDAEMLALTRWVADYYMSSWGEAIRAALPQGLGTISTWAVRLACGNPQQVISDLSARAPRQAEIVTHLSEKGEVPLKHLTRVFPGSGLRQTLQALQTRNVILVEEESARRERTAAKTELFIRLAPDYRDMDATRRMRFGPAQMRLVEALRGVDAPVPARTIRAQLGIPHETVKRLIARGVLWANETEAMREPDYGDFVEETGHTLTDAQANALEAILPAMDSHRFCGLLCHGVTGSGKTRLYLDAIQHALEQGKGAIVLVPEISLTPQTVRRFRARFGEKVAVLHSQLTAGERNDAWRALHEGRKTVAVGPRSAVFAPVHNIGLIVVDEEHDGSYKQEESDPRYHARDVAVKRAQINNIPVLLGSATPSLESFQNARSGKYGYINLPERVDDKPMPRVQVVDLRKERATGNWGSLSRPLRSAMGDRLRKGQQAVILQNRRGFSTVLQCSSCGVIVECRNCQVSLTFHRPENALKCHYCGDIRPAPKQCPECQADALRYSGTGTQKVQEEIQKTFPESVLLRMDQDTTQGRNAHHKLLEQFRKNEASVLLGTQMVAKGLDFPNVTLVGVVSADTGLGLPDFRAAERTFQLLTQVAGRTGRGDCPGEVIIQTALPDDPAILAASKHDVEGFANAELEKRLSLGYPPFGRLVLIQLRGTDEDIVARTARSLANTALGCADATVEVLGPSEAPIPKINRHWRWHILLKGSSSKALHRLAGIVKTAFTKTHQRGLHLSISVDPVALV